LNFNPFRVVEHYFRQVVDAGLPGATDYQPLMEMVARIEPVIGFRCTVPSHCDLMCVNLLEDNGGGLWLIDWEYAGMSDWRQDLSDVSGYHDYEAEHDAELLRAYAGSVTKAGVAELRTLRFMILIRCALWGAAQKVSGELAQGNYDDWIEEWTERSRVYAVTEDFLRSITFLERRQRD
jgi:thiamine kinase-like enzyme